jgi:hypothetical protein
MRLIEHAETPYRTLLVEDESHLPELHSGEALTCTQARRVNGPSYSPSRFQLLGEGLGTETMQVCMPLTENGHVVGYVLGTYSLQGILMAQVGKSLPRTQEVSFTEPDGTRLAMVGAAWRGSRMFTAQQLLDLPGNTLVLRMDSWHHAPSVFPNVMTALVTGMSIALVSWWWCWCATTAAACGRSAIWAMRWPFARPWRTPWSRACVPRSPGPHHLCEPGLLQYGGLQRRSCWASMWRLTGRPSWPRNM